jgi:hypothetical protein
MGVRIMTNELTIGRMRSLLLVPVVALVVAGCGSGSSKPSPSPSPSLTGSAAYLADVRHTGLGDLPTSSDDGLIKVGNDMCTGLSTGQSYGAAVETLTGAGKNITTAQADMLVTSAVHNLCPAQASALP